MDDDVRSPGAQDTDSNIAAYCFGCLMFTAAVLLFVASGYLVSGGSSALLVAFAIVSGIIMLVFCFCCCWYVPKRSLDDR